MINVDTWAEIRRLHKTGLKVARIARQLGVARGTVYSAIQPGGVPGYKRGERDGKLDNFKDYVRQRVIEHDLSAVRILAEIRAKGYSGGKMRILLNAARHSPAKRPRFSVIAASDPFQRRWAV